MKILVIEDDAAIVEFISIAFDIGWPGTDVIYSHQGGRGVELAEVSLPDAVILDLGLPDISGFDVLKQIRCFSEVPVIIETVRNNESDIVKGLDWGADEYIIKPFGQLELLAKVKAVLRRQPCSEISGAIVSGPLRLDAITGVLFYKNNSVHITHTENLIMRQFMENIGHAVTYSDLADIIWGNTYAGAEDTLRVYVQRIRGKLESLTNDAMHIRSLPKIGYILDT
jgi:two-component system KDP operon response regulator KdpE